MNIGQETADRQKEIYKVTLAGGAVNVLLLVFKFVAGILGHSAAMIADAIHSLSDFITDLIVLVTANMRLWLLHSSGLRFL